jgi:hypothetical protein
MKRYPTTQEAEDAGLCNDCVVYHPENRWTIRGACHSTVQGLSATDCHSNTAIKAYQSIWKAQRNKRRQEYKGV